VGVWEEEKAIPMPQKRPVEKKRVGGGGEECERERGFGWRRSYTKLYSYTIFFLFYAVPPKWDALEAPFEVSAR
jgi:hypothetical protein